MPCRVVRLTVLCLILALCCIGCPRGDSYAIVGNVSTFSELQDSMVLTGEKTLRLESTAIEGATIKLAFDEAANDIIPGIEASTDVLGDYKLSLRNLPKAKDRDGWYYLRIEKEGFKGLTYPIPIGPLSRYLKNSVYLKQLNPK